MKNYSFIIPHHNTPQLLQRLIDTIPQRDDIEIIVVDDNSDEGKKANISRPDVKTIFIDKEHTKSAGHARNIGIDIAIGKWLLFADADDMYKPGFINVLDEYKDDDIEILFFNVDSVDVSTLLPGKINRSRNINKAIKEFNGSKKSIDNLLFDCSWVPWRKMLNSEYVKKFDFRYEEIPIVNDVLFSFQTSYFVSKWKYTKDVLYTVTYSTNSLSLSSRSLEKHISMLSTKKRIAKFYRYIGHWKWNWKSARGYIVFSCIKYILVIFSKSFKDGIKVLLYYITHWIKITKGSNYYVDVIKKKKKLVSTNLNNF